MVPGFYRDKITSHDKTGSSWKDFGHFCGDCGITSSGQNWNAEKIISQLFGLIFFKVTCLGVDFQSVHFNTCQCPFCSSFLRAHPQRCVRSIYWTITEVVWWLQFHQAHGCRNLEKTQNGRMIVGTPGRLSLTSMAMSGIVHINCEAEFPIQFVFPWFVLTKCLVFAFLRQIVNNRCK